ncbi:NAD(P)H-binding protein [Jiangella anatolica]|uniref:NmrA family transcriptional regulator n=1 Tax=Jiangella anatolica TaxID=2670374 RepID=A0A2W2BEV8_9ACTN|nr:NAD(P)H-binding protein [Jiangella anatolica]PZF83800.1 NmrA family transcriptional regulator [Jiangella anatolica]
MIVVTGATGRFGPVVVDDLVARAAGDVAVVARDPEKARRFAERGVEVRQADYEDAASLERAFDGTDRLLFVSASDTTPGVRARQHANVVAAAATAKVRHVVYTSAITAEDGQSFLADHTTTEHAIRDAGLTHTFLRNTFYTEELVSPDLATAAEVVAPAIGQPLVTATIADLALAASAVLTGDGHEGAVYELRGPAWTYRQLAEALGVPYREVSDDESGMAFVLPLLRLPQFGTPTPDLERLLGRPATSVEEFVRSLA